MTLKMKEWVMSQEMQAASRSWDNKTKNSEKKQMLLRKLQKEHSPANTLISNFRPPELWEHICVVLS